MKRRSTSQKDPGIVADELLRKTEELRQMKQRMNELKEENKRTKTNASRLEKIANQQQTQQQPADPSLSSSPSSSRLNPRDAASVNDLITSQKKLLQDKDAQIAALRAGERMRDIGGSTGSKKKQQTAQSVYGQAHTQQKRALSRKSSATSQRTPSASRKSSTLSYRAHDEEEKQNNNQQHQLYDDYADDVDPFGNPQQSHHLQHPQQYPHSPPSSSLSRQASALSQHAASPPSASRMNSVAQQNLSSPTAAAGGGGMSKDEQHYLEFNKRLQERLNSSQQIHRAMIDGQGQGAQQPFSGPSFMNNDDDGGSGGGGGGGGLGDGEVNELVWIRRELRQKKAKIAALQNHFEHLTVSFRVEKDLQKLTLQQCEDLKTQVTSLQAKERQYQRQLEGMEDHRVQLESQSSIITELQEDKRVLEDRIQQLHSNLFQGDTIESLRQKQLIQEHLTQVMQLKKQVEERDAVIEKFKTAQHALQQKIDMHETLMSDKKLLHSENLLLKDKVRDLTSKLLKATIDAGVNVEDLPEMRKTLEEAEQKLHDAQVENDTKSSLLLDQYEINKIQAVKIVQVEAAMRELKMELERTKQQSRHQKVNMGNTMNAAVMANVLPTQTPAASMPITAVPTRDNLNDSRFAASANNDNQQHPDDRSDAGTNAESISTSATEEEQLTGLENQIACRITNATFNSTAFADTSSSPSHQPVTFISVDFSSDYDTSFSTVFLGYTPEYGFTTQYKFDMTQQMIEYLETDCIRVTIYQQLSEASYRIIGRTKIPLRGLVTNSMHVEGRVKVRRSKEEDEEEEKSAEDMSQQDVIGEMQFLLRMRRPISSALPSPSISLPTSPPNERADFNSRGRKDERPVASAAHYQPQIASSTLAMHHANRENNNSIMPGRGQQQQQQPQQPSQQPPTSSSFSRQPSAPSRPAVTRPQTIQQQQQQRHHESEESSSHDHDSPFHSTTPPLPYVRQPSLGRPVSHQPTPAAVGHDDDPFASSSPPAPAPGARVAVAASPDPSDPFASTPNSNSATARSMLDDDRYIESVLNDPAAQDALWDNDQNSDRQNVQEGSIADDFDL